MHCGPSCWNRCDDYAVENYLGLHCLVGAAVCSHTGRADEGGCHPDALWAFLLEQVRDLQVLVEAMPAVPCWG
jgi:hypothetical protein